MVPKLPFVAVSQYFAESMDSIEDKHSCRFIPETTYIQQMYVIGILQSITTSYIMTSLIIAIWYLAIHIFTSTVKLCYNGSGYKLQWTFT